MLVRQVDMSRVDMEIIRPWINKTITDYLGYEDDVLFEFICNQLDDPVAFVVISFLWLNDAFAML